MPNDAPAAGLPQTWALLERLGAAGPDEIVEVLTSGAAWRLERIVSHGHSAPPEPGAWYDQDEDEWVMVLTGRGRLAFDDDTALDLGPGDAVWLPAHCRHRVTWTDPDAPTVWLALFVAAQPSDATNSSSDNGSANQ